MEQPSSATPRSACWPRGPGFGTWPWSGGFACCCNLLWVWGQAPRGREWVLSWARQGAHYLQSLGDHFTLEILCKNGEGPPLGDQGRLGGGPGTPQS